MIILLQENTSFLRNKLEVVMKIQDCNTPAPLISWGKAPDIPNESGKNEVSHLFPNFVSKYRWPNKNWRTMDSPEGILQSLSTHEPPTGWNLPSRIFSLTRSKRAGYSYQLPIRFNVLRFRTKEKKNTSSSHLYCCAEVHDNLSSGYRSMRSTCADHERATFCCVTR